MIDSLEAELDMLQRHLHILQMVNKNEPIGIVKTSNETGYPHHKVRYSFRILEEGNLIEPSKQGAITTSQTNEFIETHSQDIDTLGEKLDAMKIEF